MHILTVTKYSKLKREDEDFREKSMPDKCVTCK